MKKLQFKNVRKVFVLGSLFAISSTFVAKDVSATENTPDGSFRVATYNIGALPWPASGFGAAGDPSGRVREIGNRLHHFDIVGVQEQFSAFREFRSGTRFPYFSKNKHLYAGGSGIDLLSKFPMRKTVRVTYADRPFYVAKGFSKNTVTIYPGVFVDVYNTHTGDANGTIYSQLEQLGDYIRENSPADRAVIVMGDFNTYLNHPEKPLRALVMVENNLRNVPQAIRGTSEADATGWEPVDKILFRRGSDITLTPTRHYRDNENGEYGLYEYSDHPFVMAEFDFTVANNKRLKPYQKVYLSEMKIDYGYNNGVEHGPFGINQSVGGGGEWDGRRMQMDPKQYSKGVGVHAESHIKININKKYSSFHAEVGVDEESGTKGEVRFIVIADGQEVFNSGVMRPWTATKTIDINVSEIDVLELKVSKENDDEWDHANWADAFLILK